MPSSTVSRERGLLHDVLRRLHARGLELPEWLALAIVGGGVCGGTGYNLAQFVLHGRFYVFARHGVHYWAHWHDDATAILGHGLWTLVIFAFSGFGFATALVYPLLILRWGRTSPGYKRLPPLSIRD
jgi:hypothetical protein